MLVMLFKILVPLASASVVQLPMKIATPIARYEGSYSVLSGNCGSDILIVDLHQSSSSVTVTDSGGKLIAVFPLVNLGRKDSGYLSVESTYDGFGKLKSTSFDNPKFQTTEVCLITGQNGLVFRKQIHEGYSPAGSLLDMRCELKKN